MTNFVYANFLREADFVKALVRVPSDNPPGDCARHAEDSAAAGRPWLYGGGATLRDLLKV
jgi:hypothetical protein